LQRPGGRTARNRAAVFAATLALLVEGGYANLRVDDVAARAGVHKTTIYRRWRSKDRLIAAAFMAEGERLIEVHDTGDLDRDMRVLARSVAAGLKRPEVVAAVRAIVAASPRHARENIARQYWASRLGHLRPMVERAIARGALPPGTDPSEVITAVAAPLFFRALVSAEPLTRRSADRAAAAALAAARAGVLSC
jgi:AcrR family transcriptional regulator